MNTYDLELASNLSSSKELYTDIIPGENTARKSKRLTKIDPIVRFNNPVCQDYRKDSEKTEVVGNTGTTGNGT